MYIKHLSALTHPSHRKPRLVGDLSITHAAVNEHLPQSILREPGCMFAMLVIVFAKHISGFLYVVFYFTDAATVLRCNITQRHTRKIRGYKFHVGFNIGEF